MLWQNENDKDEQLKNNSNWNYNENIKTPYELVFVEANSLTHWIRPG